MSTYLPSLYLFLFACGVATPALFGASPVIGTDVVDVVSRVNAAESERESDVRKVVCTRRYTLRNKRWETDAVMRVRFTSDGRTGKKEYEILSMQAEGLQKKVFLKILEAELEGSRRGGTDAETSVTAANYNFTMAGTEQVHGKEYLVVNLKPKRSSKFLIAGKAWVDPSENAIVRVQGETARSVSFWIGKPQITQSFRKVEDIWVSESNRSVSDVKLLGRTELTVEFDEYAIVRGAQNVAHVLRRSGF